MFVMLPLRHTNKYEHIYFVIRSTWERLEQNKTPLLIRFLKATYERYIINNKNKQFDMENIIMYKNQELNKEIIRIDSDIKNQVYKALPKNKKLILSLSGGVDSMVLSYILKSLNIEFVAVFINYCNRETAEEEEKFVIEWCMKHNITLYCRQIKEINRPKCMEYEMRDLYESYTREIRYNAYKIIAVMEQTENYVLMGHNHDDCFENILTNIANQTKFDNLLGMSISSEVDNIIFLRPLLMCGKKEIYEISNAYNIPHLPNSTPAWSQRGKIRDIVRPTMHNWNPELISGLFQVSKIMSEQDEIINGIIDDILSSMENNQFEMRITNKLLFKTIFWKNIILKCNKRFTQKGIADFINRLQRFSHSFDAEPINKVNKYELGFNTQISWKKSSKNNIVFSI